MVFTSLIFDETTYYMVVSTFYFIEVTM